MIDLVDHLRVYIRFEHPKDYETHIVWQAADEIERLREALRSLACVEGKCGCEVFGIKDVNVGCLHGVARAALEEEKE